MCGSMDVPGKLFADCVSIDGADCDYTDQDSTYRQSRQHLETAVHLRCLSGCQWLDDRSCQISVVGKGSFAWLYSDSLLVFVPTSRFNVVILQY